MHIRARINSFVGFLAAAILSLFARTPHKTTARDLAEADFKTSTQRMGIRFTEKIRDVFRFRWIRKY